VTLRVEASTDSAGIRSAVGLASANLDTQLVAMSGDLTTIKTTTKNVRQVW
jgi:hypothetical protein